MNFLTRGSFVPRTRRSPVAAPLRRAAAADGTTPDRDRSRP
jgi:hypothetical protein